MEKGDSADRDRFRRQRRNLMAISLFLATYWATGVKLPREIAFYGIKFEISNPERIVYLFWVIWAYFLARYYQYQYVLGQEKNSQFSKYYWDEMERLVGKKLFRRYVKTEKRRIKENPQGEFGHTFRLKKAKIMYLGPQYCEASLDISMAFRTATGIGSGGPNDLRVVLNGWAAFFPKLFAKMYVFLLTPYGTEYCLPYIVAVIPLAILIVRRVGLLS